MTDFYPVAVEARIKAAIAPQLRELLDLERQYKRAASIECSRRRYKLWDASELFIEGYAIGRVISDAYQAVIETVKPVVETVWNAVKPALEAIQQAQQGTQQDFVAWPPAPVPAAEHVTVERPDLW